MPVGPPGPAIARPPWGDPGELPAKIEFLWKIHESHHELIRFADTKAGAALVLASAATGWSLQALTASDIAGRPRWFEAVALSLTCLGFVATLLCSVQTIRPRFGKRPSNPPRPGLIYAGDVVRHAAVDQLVRCYAESDLAMLADELARDLWTGAAVCQRKYTWVRRAVWWSAACAFGSALTLLLLAIKVA